MEHEHVVSGLIRKRAEIAGALEDAQGRVRQLIIDIDNVDATIRLFAPDIDLEEIRPKPLPPRHAAFKGEIGRDWLDTLHTVPAEARAAADHAGPASLYSGVTARGLLASGKRSPRYYAPINERLAAAIPGAQTVRVPGAGHDGPNRAQPQVMAPLAAFLA